MKISQKIIIENNSENLKVLFLEPWGADYGMMPKDKFEIIEEEPTEDFYFHIIFDKKNILIRMEGSGSTYPVVLQDGKELLCGHNLR